jgi:adenylosuccinate lyase
MRSTDPRTTYESPLTERYASEEMSRIFSPAHRYGLWRDLWIWLAEGERDLGLPITEAQIRELVRGRDPIDFDRVAEIETEVRHEVIAHLRAYGEACPTAKPILHLGATSAYVMDNSDLIQMKQALGLVLRKVANVIDALARFAERHRDRACLGYTHFQSAQPTTVGKRACLWIQELLLDLEELEGRIATLPFRGVKGTTGTQASFLRLFDGDHDKVKALDLAVTRRAGFDRPIAVCGQTYTRKVDAGIAATLAGIAVSSTKFAGDVRLLAGLKEVEEPFREKQVGSSAMAYKRNPMRCERIAALARTVLIGSRNLDHTAALQWLERSLDDSANRRVIVPELFLATDVILETYLEVASGLQVNEKVIASRLAEELPFLGTENLLMEAVAAGGDRQDVHERIRVHARAAAEAVKEGSRNDLLDRLRQDPAFAAVRDRLDSLLEPRLFVGRAPQQVDEFLAERVRPVLDRHRAILGHQAKTRV